MQDGTAYRIEEETATAELLFHHMGWLQMRTRKVEARGRFFTISKPGANPAPYSMS